MSPTEADDLIELLYADAVDIYERARREVMIPRRDGTMQRYAPTRYKQQIDRAYADGTLVPAIARIVREPTIGFGHLGDAGRPDLMVETLVTDTGRPYHRLFSAETVRRARDRLSDYARAQAAATHGPTASSVDGTEDG